jgi:putative transposase
VSDCGLGNSHDSTGGAPRPVAAKSSYSAAKIAAMKVAGYPTSERRIRARAEAEGWKAVEVAGRGGPRGVRREYSVSGLPEDLRIALLLRQTDPGAVGTTSTGLTTLPAPSLPVLAVKPNAKPENLATWQIDIARARAAVLDQVSKLADIVGPRKARGEFMRLFNAAAFDGAAMDIYRSANARAGDARTLNEGTVWRWQRLVEGKTAPHDIIVALAPGGRGRRYTPFADEALALALFRRPNKPALAWCVREALKTCPGATETALEKRVKRLMKKVPAPTFYPGRNSGAALKALQVFRRREFESLLPNDVWVGDGHAMKMRVAHPETGKPFVPELTVVMDVQSRYIVGWSVSFSENVLAVADALRHGMSRHGLPLIYYSDNGSGQTAKMLDQDIIGLLPTMGVWHETGIPGNPQGRGVMERWWETVAVPLARCYATYRGQGADRDTQRLVSIEIDKQIREIQRADGVVTALPAKLPAFRAFMADLDRAIEEYNTTHRHSSLPKLDGTHHATPAEYRAARMQDVPGGIAIPDASVTSLMFMPAEVRKAQRGEVKLWNGIYYHADLMLADGEQVKVHYDIHDASRVWVKRLTGELVAVAELNGNRSGFFPKPFIESLRDKRTQGRVQLLERKLAGVLEEHAAGALPVHGLRPTINAAPDTPEQAADRAALAAEMASNVTRLKAADEQDDWAVYRRCLGIEQRMAAGEVVGVEDAAWCRSYQGTADYLARRGMAEDFPQLVEESKREVAA